MCLDSAACAARRASLAAWSVAALLASARSFSALAYSIGLSNFGAVGGPGGVSCASPLIGDASLMLASFTGVEEGSELCWLPGSTSGAGRNLGTGRKVLEISTAVVSRRATTTRLPICVMPQNFRANPSGSLMQPCEAG